MEKIILELGNVTDRDTLYDKITEAFDFPSYFGRNLDALYDCLTELDRDTCVGLFLPEEIAHPEAEEADTSFHEYLLRLHRTFLDAEAENPHLCVICGVSQII